MKKTKILEGIIILLLIFVVLQAGSAAFLFYLKTGFTVEGVKRFFRPDLFDNLAQASTYLGVIKLVLPHILAMGLLSFVLAHFLWFVPRVSPMLLWVFGLTVSFMVLLHNLAPFLVIYHSASWAWLYFLSFIFFELGIFWAFFVCVADILDQSILEESTNKSKF